MSTQDTIDNLLDKIQSSTKTIYAKKGFITDYIHDNKENYKAIKRLRYETIELLEQRQKLKDQLTAMSLPQHIKDSLNAKLEEIK